MVLAKCDLGELSNPGLPPCARCRREGVVCEFLPSRRGGRIPFSNQMIKEEGADSVQAPLAQNLGRSTEARGDGTGHASDRVPKPLNGKANHRTYPMYPSQSNEGPLDSTSKVNGGPTSWLQATTSLPPHSSSQYFPNGTKPSSYLTSNSLPPLISSDIFRLPQYANSNPLRGPSTSDGSPHSDQQRTPSDSTGSSSLNLNPAVSTNLHRDKRRKDDAEMAAAASLRNPVDALDLLVMAAKAKDATDRVAASDNGIATDSDMRDHTTSYTSPPGLKEGHSNGKTRNQPIVSPPSLSTFPLIKNRVLTINKLIDLVDIFFSRIHFVFPIIPYNRIPKTEQQVAKFAHEELHLTTVIVVIASRNEKDMGIHDKSWAYMQVSQVEHHVGNGAELTDDHLCLMKTLISKIMLGECNVVGATEALLLLSGKSMSHAIIDVYHRLIMLENFPATLLYTFRVLTASS